MLHLWLEDEDNPDVTNDFGTMDGKTLGAVLAADGKQLSHVKDDTKQFPNAWLVLNSSRQIIGWLEEVK